MSTSLFVHRAASCKSSFTSWSESSSLRWRNEIPLMKIHSLVLFFTRSGPRQNPGPTGLGKESPENLKLCNAHQGSALPFEIECVIEDDVSVCYGIMGTSTMTCAHATQTNPTSSRMHVSLQHGKFIKLQLSELHFSGKFSYPPPCPLLQLMGVDSTRCLFLVTTGVSVGTEDSLESTGTLPHFSMLNF